MMRVTVTGATGLIGSKLVAALKERGDEVTVLSRRPADAERMLGVEAIRWNPETEAAPAAALAGRDGVVHLAGEPIAQRWTDKSKDRIRSSREVGTTLLVEGLRRCEARPHVLVSASAIGYYGDHGDERLDESAPPGSGFLADVCEGWERAARTAAELDIRVVNVRTGVLLDPADGALSRMLLPFRLGVGGPVAGGDQYISWVAPDDLIRLYLVALEEPDWSGPVNATAPEPVTNRAFSQALGRTLHRPAILPIPGFVLQLLYGEMASVVITGQRVLPARALEHGFEFHHPTVGAALTAAVRSG